MKADLYSTLTAEECKKAKELLLKNWGEQISNIFILGLFLGIRIKDLLNLKFSDFINNKKLLIASNRSCHVNTNIYVSPEVKEIIAEIRNQHPTDEYIFQSRHRTNCKQTKPISKQYVYKAFKNISDQMNVKLSAKSIRNTYIKSLIEAVKPENHNPVFIYSSLKKSLGHIHSKK
tara:strand:+ start:22325 stop:22849 length:525 start_codon:yes stop_codon:yes gene_type:complete